MGIEKLFENSVKENLDVKDIIKDIAEILRNGIESEPIEEYQDSRIEGKHVIPNTGTNLEYLEVSDSIIKMMMNMKLLRHLGVETEGNPYRAEGHMYLAFTKKAEELYKQLKEAKYFF